MLEDNSCAWEDKSRPRRKNLKRGGRFFELGERILRFGGQIFALGGQIFSTWEKYFISEDKSSTLEDEFFTFQDESTTLEEESFGCALREIRKISRLSRDGSDKVGWGGGTDNR